MKEMQTNKMKALVFHKTGLPDEVLQVAEVDIPEPQEGEVRIKMLSSPINPADILFIAGQYRYKPQFPQIAGVEGTGIIDKVGENVNLPLGTLVAFRYRNVWAQYVNVPAEKLTVLPADFPMDKASQFSLNPVTAYALLLEAKVKQNDWLLLTSGSSAISKLLIQFAAEQRINTIAIIRNQKDINSLKSIGVTEVLLSDSENLKQNILAITNNLGVNAILDAVGGSLLTQLIECMALNGQLILYGLLSKEKACFHNSDIIFRNITIQGFGIDKWLSSIDTDTRHKVECALISKLMKADLILPVASRWKFESFAEAIQELNLQKNEGKVLLTF